MAKSSMGLIVVTVLRCARKDLCRSAVPVVAEAGIQAGVQTVKLSAATVVAAVVAAVMDRSQVVIAMCSWRKDWSPAGAEVAELVVVVAQVPRILHQ